MRELAILTFASLDGVVQAPRFPDEDRSGGFTGGGWAAPHWDAVMESQDGPLLQVHGSGQLIQTLLSHELVDEFRLWIFPVIVGSGKRLFDQNTVPTRLKLTRTATGPSGVIMSIYRRAPS